MRHHRIGFLAVGLGVLAFAPAAFADLNPPPPDFYSCSANGGGTICRAQLVGHEDPVPIDDLCPFSITSTDTGENQYTDPVTHKNVLHTAGRSVSGPDGSLEYAGQQPFLDFFMGDDPHAFDPVCAALAP